MRIDIRRWRLAGQFLTAPGPREAAEVVRSLGAVQAQDYAGAKWGIAQRMAGGPATEASVEREIDAGRVLRTHVLRPTWHFVSPADIRWMLELTGPRVMAMTAPANRRLGLDRDIFRRSNAVFGKVLAGGRFLTRIELKAHLERARVKITTSQQLGHLMMQAEVEGVLCSGPRRGKQFTYALLDERVSPAPPLKRDEALLELTRRYFATRSPATPRDFAWWSGLTITDAKRGIDMAGTALERVTLGAATYWIDPRTPTPTRPARSAHLLPNYDEYFIGFRDRSSIAERVKDSSTVTGGNALIPCVIIVDGELVGLWRRTLEKRGAVLTLKPLIRLTPSESKRVSAAAHKFGHYLDQSMEVRIA